MRRHGSRSPTCAHRNQRDNPGGTGPCLGLTASVAGASVVTLVDREPLALHCAMSTADLCGIPTGPLGNPEAAPGMVCAIRCDWAEASAALASQADVVLGSEVRANSQPGI
eukprot:scaffold299920_cov23-Tisochrysis_lutea.AAC.2